MPTALLAGATGLVGRNLLDLLLAAPEYDRVITLGRRNVDLTHPKLEQVIVDFAAHGWVAHDRSHPTALTAKADDQAPAEESVPPRACCLSNPAAGVQATTSCGTGCCRN